MALSLTDKIMGFFARPVETFRAVRDEDLVPPIIYYVVLLIINAILVAIVAYLGYGTAANEPPGVGAFIAGLIGAIIAGILGLLLWAVFLHIGAKIMGGRGDFADSFKPAVYAQTPSLLIGWLSVIPIIGWLIGIILFIWTLVLLFLGVRELHEMDTMKAVITVVIAAVLYIIVIAIIAAILALIGIAIVGGIAGLENLPGYVPPDL
jgi:hypothetical protein